LRVDVLQKGVRDWTPDGAFLKFDGKGNEQAVAALKSAQKKDYLRVTVTGDRDGDAIKVTSLKM
jgi:hypothetical protein